MKRSLLLFVLLVSLLLSGSTYAPEGIIFTFANGTITGSGTLYYEFDIMIAGTWGGTTFGDLKAYVNYNTTAFGSSIAGTGKITATMSSAMTSNGNYVLPVLNNASTSQVSIYIAYGGSPAGGVTLPASAIQWAHVKIEIANTASSSGLGFDSSSMDGNQYQDDGTTPYPVTADDSDDTSLPVTMNGCTATVSREAGVTICWRTESETNTAGFNVHRSRTLDGDYMQINNTLIPGQGNSSYATDYSFSDRNIQEGVQYWYKIEEVSTSSSSTFFGPVSVMGVSTVPDDFELSQNYPNPFNPETSFQYRVPEQGYVTISVYNLLGKEIKRLIAEDTQPGFYTATWDGSDRYGVGVSSGIYFIRMRAGSFTMVRKVSLMR